MRRGRAIARQNTGSRRWLTLAALLAFFLQGLAVQTHVHDLGPVKAPVHATTSYKAPPSAPLKSQDLNDQCRLCQELVHAGVFIAPSVAILYAGTTFTLATPLAVAPAIPLVAGSFAWRSRAPPRS